MCAGLTRKGRRSGVSAWRRRLSFALLPPASAPLDDHLPSLSPSPSSTHPAPDRAARRWTPTWTIGARRPLTRRPPRPRPAPRSCTARASSRAKPPPARPRPTSAAGARRPFTPRRSPSPLPAARARPTSSSPRRLQARGRSAGARRRCLRPARPTDGPPAPAVVVVVVGGATGRARRTLRPAVARAAAEGAGVGGPAGVEDPRASRRGASVSLALAFALLVADVD